MESKMVFLLLCRAIELPAIEISLAEMADHVGLECGSSVVEAEVIVVGFLLSLSNKLLISFNTLTITNECYLYQANSLMANQV